MDISSSTNAQALLDIAKRVEKLEEENARLREALRSIRVEAERESGHWQHLKRVIGLNARQALEHTR